MITIAPCNGNFNVTGTLSNIKHNWKLNTNRCFPSLKNIKWHFISKFTLHPAICKACWELTIIFKIKPQKWANSLLLSLIYFCLISSSIYFCLISSSILVSKPLKFLFFSFWSFAECQGSVTNPWMTPDRSDRTLTVLKGRLTQNMNIDIIYSTPRHSKPVWIYLFCGA